MQMVYQNGNFAGLFTTSRTLPSRRKKRCPISSPGSFTTSMSSDAVALCTSYSLTIHDSGTLQGNVTESCHTIPYSGL